LTFIYLLLPVTVEQNEEVLLLVLIDNTVRLRKLMSIIKI